MKKVLCSIMGGGCAQIQAATGVMAAFDQLGIHIDQYRGASAGACVAALHASGMTGGELTTAIKGMKVSQLFKFDLWKLTQRLLGVNVDSLLNNRGMYEFLRDHITAKAATNTRVTVTRADNYDSYMMDATPVTVLASAAIPQIFPPIKIGKHYYVDGGVKNLIPVPKISQINNYQHIYLVLCPNQIQGKEPNSLLRKAVKAFMQTMDREVTGIYEQGWDELPNVTVVQPPAYDIDLLDWSQNHELIQKAKQYTLKLLKKEQQG